jgi:hypothetical protein
VYDWYGPGLELRVVCGLCADVQAGQEVVGTLGLTLFDPTLVHPIKALPAPLLAALAAAFVGGMADGGCGGAGSVGATSLTNHCDSPSSTSSVISKMIWMVRSPEACLLSFGITHRTLVFAEAGA